MYYYKRNQFPPMWREMARYHRDLNRYFDEQLPSHFLAGGNTPTMNIYTSSEDAIVSVELPGVNPEAVEISVVGDTLSITGERSLEELGDKTTFHRQERFSGKFNRSIQLPFPVEADKVEAKMDKGVLTIRLPRAEEDKPRRINVNS